MHNYIVRAFNKLGRFFIDSAYRLDVEQLILSKKKGAAIVCYHGIDLSEKKDFNMRFYSIKSMEEHFCLYTKYFNVITIKQFFNNEFDANKFNIAISFDDGYLNNYKYLLPLVEKYRLPVSVYVSGINKTKYNFLWADFVDIVSYYSDKKRFTVDGVTFERMGNHYLTKDSYTLQEIIKKKGSFDFKEKIFTIFDDFTSLVANYNLDDYYKLMTDNEIIKLSESEYITIGSHGFYHDNLGNVDLEKAKLDLVKSKKYLESVLQKPIDELAYPDGSYSDEIITEANKIGFKYQLILNHNQKKDIYNPLIRARHGMCPVFSNIYQVSKIKV